MNDQIIGDLFSSQTSAIQDHHQLQSLINRNNDYLLNAIMSSQNMEMNHTALKTVKTQSFKKRKTQNLKAVAEEKAKSKDKTDQTSKVTEEDKKQDYIHVRARPGQATDSHSLAERVRREKISERMKYLQDLVPGCEKVTGKAGMLDEIINYVQSLQKQVEFLSMKLAAVNPRLDMQMIQSNFSLTSEIETSSNIDFNLLQLVLSSSGFETGINPSEMALQRTINVQNIPNWDFDLQNLYAMDVQEQGRSSQPFMGFVDGNVPRMQI